MSYAEIVPQQFHLAYDVASQMPHLVPLEAPHLFLIEGGKKDDEPDYIDTYLDNRKQYAMQELVDGEALTEIQWAVRQWAELEAVIIEPRYGVYDRQLSQDKIGRLADFLKSIPNNGISDIEFEMTDGFIQGSFDMYEGTAEPRKDGSFAFIVPARVSRNNTEYGQEVEPLIPLLRYVPNEMRAQFMVGLPPLVVDRYDVDASGRRGYLVFAPVFGDMEEDLGKIGTIKTARKTVNDAVDFASERLGVEVVGLGAVLPSITQFGKQVTNKDVIITTGHGGTTQLIKDTVTAAIEDGYVTADAANRIGVLGLGSIGASIAHLIADAYPNSEIRIYDANHEKICRTIAEIALAEKVTVLPCENEAQLIRDCNIIISAITGTVDMSLVPEAGTMHNKIVIDDSQPGSFDPAQVEALGGNVTWVVGTDASGRVRREGYDYGTLANAQSDLFGCEAEAATLAAYLQDLRRQGVPNERAKAIVNRVALQQAVTPYKARLFGALFKRYGIGTAEFQAFGLPLAVPQTAIVA